MKNKFTNETVRITCAYSHGLREGDVVEIGPTLFRVKDVGVEAFTTTPLSWYRAAWWRICHGRWIWRMVRRVSASLRGLAQSRKPLCADCGKRVGREGPPNGWKLEDGRTVCHACCVADTRRIASNL